VTVDSQVTLTTTDQEVGLVQSDNYEHEGTTDVLVNAKQIDTLLGKLKCAEVTCSIGDSGATFDVSTSTARFSLPITELVQDFPPVSTDRAGDVTAVVDAGDLAQLLRQTRYAATDAQSTRYALGGVLCEIGPQILTCVATDTQRLVVHSAHAETVEAGQGIVPSSAVDIVARLLESGPVSLALHRSAPGASGATDYTSITVSALGWVVHSRLVEGRFPKYEQVIPQRFEHVVTVPVVALRESLEAVSLVCDDSMLSCSLCFNGDAPLSLHCSSLDNGESTAQVPVVAVIGQECCLTIELNSQYILDYLLSLNKWAVSVDLHLIDAKSACLFSADGQARGLIMPLRNR